MTTKTSIEWTDVSWNPTTGCAKVSPGCERCFAATLTRRFPKRYPNGFSVTLLPETLFDPFRLRKPSLVFVNSMSDLFHDLVPAEYIARVLAVMALTPQHTYQLLTKRHARMRSLLSGRTLRDQVSDALIDLREHAPIVFSREQQHVLSWPARRVPWPLPNLWIGVSVEDQRWADLRIPALLETPASLRWVSAEPLLGEVRLRRWLGRPGGLDWVVAGGESGTGARPMHPAWAAGVRNQCDIAGVPFFFKQWGSYRPWPRPARAESRPGGWIGTPA